MPVESFCVCRRVKKTRNLGYVVVDGMIVYSANSRSSRNEAHDRENNRQL